MSVQRVRRSDGRPAWKVRWRDGSRQPSRLFDRKRDAETFEREVKRRRQLGTLASLDAGQGTLGDYVTGTWAKTHAATLAPKTRELYAGLYDNHLAPRFADTPLREITPETISRWQSDQLAAGAGRESTRKALTLLGGILQRAAEARHIAYNPARLVRKAPPALRAEVRPLAPVTVEAIRAVCGPRDATLVSVLAYAGLRPQEARALCWGHVRDRTLVVGAEKTRTRRTVRLLVALRQDLAEWRMSQGRPGDHQPVFLGARGAAWTENAYEMWRAKTWARSLAAAGLAYQRPYDLRHSFASLLLHEGRSVHYVARQLGHGADMTLRTYGHVVDELEDAPAISADDAIRVARESVRALSVPQGRGGTA